MYQCTGLQAAVMVKMVLTGNVSRVSHLFPAHRIFRGANTAQYFIAVKVVHVHKYISMAVCRVTPPW